MAFEHEKSRALALLKNLEDGSAPSGDLATRLEQADPTLVYFIFTWLRAHYRPSHPAAQGVLGRLVEVCGASPTVARHAKEGGNDPVVAWFEDAHNYRELDAESFIDSIVEKLEG